MGETKPEVTAVTHRPARRWWRINGGWVEAFPGETRSDVEKALRSMKMRLAEAVT